MSVDSMRKAIDLLEQSNRNLLMEDEQTSVNQEKIIAKAEKYFDFTITPTVDAQGFISSKGSIYSKVLKMDQLPVKFLTIEGDFYVSNLGLKSLAGCPKHVGQDFSGSGNDLNSLIGGPISVDGNYNCRNSKLNSLEGSPKNVSGVFNCIRNNLTNLKDGPEYVGDTYECRFNPIQTFEGFDTNKSSNGNFYYSITSDLPLLRLLRLQCDIISYDEHNLMVYALSDIFRKYKGDTSRKNILACQRDLIDAGYEGNARW